ncbi:MAG TPA: hypothetical protein VN721_13865 [Flavipsychrobacter sp.]|nr:hypothetical protein [Flavipsychrobacter sp.]
MKLSKTILIFFIFLVCCHNNVSFAQKTINSDLYRYTLVIPNSLLRTADSIHDIESDREYYDSTIGILLFITARDGIFTNTKHYIDCSKEDLEKELKAYQSDPALKLIECSRSKYFPDKIVMLHFETSVLPAGFNRCIVYFVHHYGKEIQFSFMYNKANEELSLEYIDHVMQSLALL